MNPSPLIRSIPFTKAVAYGNDFLIVDGVHISEDIADLSRRLCDRNNGIGADGVEWLFPAQTADVSARLMNADGSEAEISGNGTRCVAAYLCAQQQRAQQQRQEFTIQTVVGEKKCKLILSDEREYEFEIAMGQPKVSDELSVQLKDGRVRGIPVSTGNPHYVMFVEQFAAGWQAHAAEIGQMPIFPRGVNVELVVLSGLHDIEIRIFERGVGETQSSGTGSCAAAVAAIASGRAESPIKVRAPGGAQIVRWDQGEGGEVFLQGTAQLIGRGEFFV